MENTPAPLPRRSFLRRVAGTLAVQVTVALVVVGATVGVLDSRRTPHTVPPRDPVGACHSGNPLAGVHDPGRLQVVDGCAFVTGTVLCRDANPAGDGDHHIVVRVDPAYRHELTATNRLATCGGRGGEGNLVVEIIPQACRSATVAQNLSGEPTNCADSAGFPDPPLPVPGERVAVIGPLVLDQNHPVNGVGWTEIHPAERILALTVPPRLLPNGQLCLPGGGDPHDAAQPAAAGTGDPATGACTAPTTPGDTGRGLG